MTEILYLAIGLLSCMLMYVIGRIHNITRTTRRTFDVHKPTEERKISQPTTLTPLPPKDYEKRKKFVFVKTANRTLRAIMDKGITIPEIAKATGVDDSTLYNIRSMKGERVQKKTHLPLRKYLQSLSVEEPTRSFALCERVGLLATDDNIERVTKIACNGALSDTERKVISGVYLENHNTQTFWQVAKKMKMSIRDISETETSAIKKIMQEV